MVRNVIIAILVLLLAIAGYLLYRRPGPPPPRPDISLRTPPEQPDNLKNLNGVVVSYEHNAHLDVNAVRVKTATEGVIVIDFRPHTAKTVMEHAAIGDSVEVTTGSNPNDESIVYQLHRIENLRTREVADLDQLP